MVSESSIANQYRNAGYMSAAAAVVNPTYIILPTATIGTQNCLLPC